ncbi:hypothetical protein AVEN_115286-1 [Araneus ventricosus]|uniref:Uncharacterized protein n=1 Tax=Araneus ventricosus TaxID=182803 RepID=A0A4Y1ZZ47_ARAVE|nr:hypothetical protein AVEN_115286-1 [Araneus ventricosus]
MVNINLLLFRWTQRTVGEVITWKRDCREKSPSEELVTNHWFSFVKGPRWPSGKALASGSGPLARNPIPPKIRRVWGPLHAKSYAVAKRPPAGAARKLGGGWRHQPRCPPRHLTVVQNYEVRPKIALVLLQNGALM